MIRVSIPQEDITILNIYVPNSIASNFMKQKKIEKKEIISTIATHTHKHMYKGILFHVQKNETKIHATTWRRLKDIIISEISQIQRDNSIYMRFLK